MRKNKLKRAKQKRNLWSWEKETDESERLWVPITSTFSLFSVFCECELQMWTRGSYPQFWHQEGVKRLSQAKKEEKKNDSVWKVKQKSPWRNESEWNKYHKLHPFPFSDNRLCCLSFCSKISFRNTKISINPKIIHLRLLSFSLRS